MAEIKIREKKPVWPWILLVLLLIAALLYFFVLTDDDSVDDMDDIDDATTEQVMSDDLDDEGEMYGKTNNAGDDLGEMDGEAYNEEEDESEMNIINRYTNYIGEKGEMSLDHEYTHNALTYLVEAVRSIAKRNKVDIEADLSEAKINADIIKRDPMADTHANNIKNASLILSKALNTIQQKSFPDLEEDAKAVHSSATEIAKGELTLDQKGSVNKFFKTAKTLLLKMQ